MSDGKCTACITAGCPWRSDMVLGCSHYTPKSETNYERLFGTPELAARTLARMCAIGDGSCAGCPMYKANVEHCESDYTHLKSIVDWLRGDA